MSFRTLREVLAHPSTIPAYLSWRINLLRVRRVVADGAVHHRYRGELYPDFLNHGNACSFIAAKALTCCRGKGIDVGASEWPLPGAIPVRDEAHQNAYRLDGFADASLDYVFSSHCIEHLERWKEALDLWVRKLRPGGVLFLYAPHESMRLWRRGGPWVGLGHKWIPTAEALVSFLRERGMEIVEYEPGRDAYWSFHVCSRKLTDSHGTPAGR